MDFHWLLSQYSQARFKAHFSIDADPYPRFLAALDSSTEMGIQNLVFAKQFSTT
jgi:hypothetical protein